jgi:hypothetical protein
LTFECYNLLDPMEFLEVDVQQDNFKILWLLPQVLILFLVEKWILLSRSKTAEIGQKNRRNFRG